MKPSFHHQLNQIFSFHGNPLFNYILCACSAHVNAFMLKSSKVNFVFCKRSSQTDSIPAIQKRRACEKAFAFSHAFLSLLCDGHLPFLYFRTFSSFGLVSYSCSCGLCRGVCRLFGVYAYISDDLRFRLDSFYKSLVVDQDVAAAQSEFPSIASALSDLLREEPPKYPRLHL